jgi:hypothetical protein
MEERRAALERSLEDLAARAQALAQGQPGR